MNTYKVDCRRFERRPSVLWITKRFGVSQCGDIAARTLPLPAAGNLL